MTAKQVKANDRRSVLDAVGVKIGSRRGRYKVRLKDGAVRCGESIELNARSNAFGERKLVVVDGARVFVGGGGVVLQCREKKAASVHYALKIARPSLFNAAASARRAVDPDEEYRRTNQEFLNHLPLAHPNVAKMVHYGSVELPGANVHHQRIPYTLVEWVHGAKPLGEYLSSAKLSPAGLIGCLTQCFRALGHVHAHGLVHWDVKSDNLLVSDQGEVKLMDLGNARLIGRADDSEVAYSSRVNLPPLLESVLSGEDIADASSNRLPVHLESAGGDWDLPFLDLYMLGREVNRVFGFDRNALECDRVWLGTRDWEVAEERRHRVRARLEQQVDGRYCAAFVGEIVRRVLGYSAPSGGGYYEEAHEVVRALERFAPENGEADGVPELGSVAQNVLRVPPVVNVPWTKRVRRVADSIPLTWLRDHLQLATVHRVYPGAAHSRWEHSLGTLRTSILYLQALFSDRSSPFMRLQTSQTDVCALMLASLLHDVGHPAFGHQLEECTALGAQDTHEYFVDQMLSLLSTGEFDGELRLERGTREQIEAFAEVLRPLLLEDWCDGDREVEKLVSRIRAVIRGSLDHDAEWRESSRVKQFWRQRHIQVLHSIVNGPMDADKLDYLLRDGVHCGVNYSQGIDYSRLIQSMTTVVSRTDQGTEFRSDYSPQVKQSVAGVGAIAVSLKGVLPLESFLCARYQMFRGVYWHHTVRSLTAQLSFAVERYLFGNSRSISGSARRTRVDELLCVFRSSSDADAARWLLEELTDLQVGRSARSRSRDVLSARAAMDCVDALLGDRDDLYSCVLEVFAHSAPGFGNAGRETAGLSPEDGTRSGQGQRHLDDRLFRAVERVWSRNSVRADGSDTRPEGDSSEPERDVLYERRKLRQRLTTGLRGRLGVSISVLRDGDVLIDLPESMSQVRGLFVAAGDRLAETCGIDEVSAISSAMEDAFSRTGRTLRVFFARRALSKCLERGKLGASEVADAVRDEVWKLVPSDASLFSDR